MRTPNEELRNLVAEEAARLIYEEGFRDYRLAKLRAAEQLGASTPTAQPTNEEIETAIHERIRLFDADTQPKLLQQHREVALEAMDFLQTYHPYLTGAALEVPVHIRLSPYCWARIVRKKSCSFWKTTKYPFKPMTDGCALAVKSQSIFRYCAFMWMKLKWS